MDIVFSITSTDHADGDDDNNTHLHQELNALRNSYASEMERTSLLGAEVARLHESLNKASQMCSDVHQLRAERDMYKQKLEDQLQFKRGPLEARLLEANRVLYEQRLQFRGIVDYLSMQRDWVREWAVLGRENMRMREMMEKRESGSETEELRRVLFDLQSKLSETLASVRQYEAVVAVHESKVRSVSLENDRLMAENNLLKEQAKRLMDKYREVQSAGDKRSDVVDRSLLSSRVCKKANCSDPSQKPAVVAGTRVSDY